MTPCEVCFFVLMFNFKRVSTTEKNVLACVKSRFRVVNASTIICKVPLLFRLFVCFWLVGFHFLSREVAQGDSIGSISQFLALS